MGAHPADNNPDFANVNVQAGLGGSYDWEELHEPGGGTGDLTQEEADLLYDAIGSAAAALLAAEEYTDDLVAAAEVNAAAYTDSAIGTHASDPDAHGDFLTEVEADLLYDAIGAATAVLVTAQAYTDAHVSDSSAAHAASAVSADSTTLAGVGTTVQAVLEELDDAIAAISSHAEDHDHDGSPTQKLTQANTHQSPDTDSGSSALHHTLGSGSAQAAAGDHTHAATGTVVDIYTSSDTWTKPSGAKLIEVWCLGGGGGGGSGGAGTSDSGGGGGGGGEWTMARFFADDVGGTEAIVVGAGGTGANGVTGNTNGQAGSSTSTTTQVSKFGDEPWTYANGGQQGVGGTSSSGNGGAGGAESGGQRPYTMFDWAGGDGGGGDDAANGNAGQTIQHGSTYAVDFVRGATGGGGGGGHDTTFKNGGNGGRRYDQDGGLGATTQGGPGANGNTPASDLHPGTGGGGGAGSRTGNGGDGGDGRRGGGGGGGGSSLTGTSGAGGDGAAGLVVVITYR